MEHVSKKTGKTYQVAEAMAQPECDGVRKTYDMTLYIYFPTELEFINDTSSVYIAGWHFGPYTPEDAEEYIID